MRIFAVRGECSSDAETVPWTFFDVSDPGKFFMAWVSRDSMSLWSEWAEKTSWSGKGVQSPETLLKLDKLKTIEREVSAGRRKPGAFNVAFDSKDEMLHLPESFGLAARCAILVSDHRRKNRFRELSFEEEVSGWPAFPDCAHAIVDAENMVRRGIRHLEHLDSWKSRPKMKVDAFCVKRRISVEEEDGELWSSMKERWAMIFESGQSILVDRQVSVGIPDSHDELPLPLLDIIFYKIPFSSGGGTAKRDRKDDVADSFWDCLDKVLPDFGVAQENIRLPLQIDDSIAGYGLFDEPLDCKARSIVENCLLSSCNRELPKRTSASSP